MIVVFSLFLPAEIPKAFFVACGILIITPGDPVYVAAGACVTRIILLAA
jgi:hypothetical protein